MKALARVLLTGSAVVAAVTAVVIATNPGNAHSADQMPSVVENYEYPGREQIESQDKVKLIAGDGNIIYADCTQPPTGPVGLIEVRSTSLEVGKQHDGRVCFRVLGTTGNLTMKLPDVFEIRGDGRQPGTGHKGKADVVSNSGQQKTVELDPDGSMQVGVGNPGGEPSTLLRLEITS